MNPEEDSNGKTWLLVAATVLLLAVAAGAFAASYAFHVIMH